MASKIKELKSIEEGIELISTGLLLIDQNREALEALAGSNIVDITARLNAQYNTIHKWLDPLKDAIKAYALRGNLSCVPGGAYEANVNRVSKTVVNMDSVKTYLGDKLSHFMKTRNEVTISFDVKA